MPFWKFEKVFWILAFSVNFIKGLNSINVVSYFNYRRMENYNNRKYPFKPFLLTISNFLDPHVFKLEEYIKHIEVIEIYNKLHCIVFSSLIYLLAIFGTSVSPIIWVNGMEYISSLGGQEKQCLLEPLLCIHFTSICLWSYLIS